MSSAKPMKNPEESKCVLPEEGDNSVFTRTENYLWQPLQDASLLTRSLQLCFLFQENRTKGISLQILHVS